MPVFTKHISAIATWKELLRNGLARTARVHANRWEREGEHNSSGVQVRNNVSDATHLVVGRHLDHLVLWGISSLEGHLQHRQINCNKQVFEDEEGFGQWPNERNQSTRRNMLRYKTI
jgi:hypothetical protein